MNWSYLGFLHWRSFWQPNNSWSSYFHIIEDYHSPQKWFWEGLSYQPYQLLSYRIQTMPMFTNSIDLLQRSRLYSQNQLPHCLALSWSHMPLIKQNMNYYHHRWWSNRESNHLGWKQPWFVGITDMFGWNQGSKNLNRDSWYLVPQQAVLVHRQHR